MGGPRSFFDLLHLGEAAVGEDEDAPDSERDSFFSTP
jgi:hypothetical protein